MEFLVFFFPEPNKGEPTCSYFFSFLCEVHISVLC